MSELEDEDPITTAHINTSDKLLMILAGSDVRMHLDWREQQHTVLRAIAHSLAAIARSVR